MTSSPSRRAATLIEVIVVAAITSILLALTLAAVQRVRASAHRAACANNLRQVGTALHSYHNSHHVFPPGAESPGKNAKLPYLCWQARLLPHLEQSAVWDGIPPAYQQNPVSWTPPPHANRDLVIPVLGCPADARVGIHRPGRNGLTSYMGVSGTSAVRCDGIIFLDSAVKGGDVADGLSNTLLVGERPPSADLRFGWWYAGWGQPTNGSAFDAFFGVADRNIPLGFGVPEDACPQGPYRFQPGSFENQCDAFHFWSPHSGGAHFLFADSSVRLLRYSAADVLPVLATRAGGEPTPDFD